MEYIKVTEHKVEALPDADYIDCVRRAITLAMETMSNVRLLHADSEYLIQPKQLLHTIEICYDTTSPDDAMECI